MHVEVWFSLVYYVHSAEPKHVGYSHGYLVVEQQKGNRRERDRHLPNMWTTTTGKHKECTAENKWEFIVFGERITVSNWNYIVDPFYCCWRTMNLDI